MKKALTIAGSDPSGGAGIQADLKTFGALKVYGMAVITSLTAQNTLGVEGSYDIPPEFIGKQIDSIASDMGIETAKTGMLANAGIVRTVAQRLRKYRVKKLVVDPVMVSKNGASLLDAEGQEAMMQFLIPLAFLVTPNIPEAEILAGMKIRSLKDMEKAAKKIKTSGAKNVLIKGGHLNKNPTDIFYDGKNFTRFTLDWVDTKNTHGTGCTLSAAITAEIATGSPLGEAIQNAKEYLHFALRNAYTVGKGIGPVHHYARLYRKAEEVQLAEEMNAALRILKEEKVGSLIPEVQSNLAVALTNAASHKDVLAFPGRIIKDGDAIATLHPPALGASRHIANIVLTNMRYDPAKRACMNIRYDKKIIAACKSLKLTIGSFDRAKEPKSVRDKEGSTLEWGVQRAIEKNRGQVTDIVFDKGGVGKEAVIRVSGNSALEVAKIVVKIYKDFSKKTRSPKSKLLSS